MKRGVIVLLFVTLGQPSAQAQTTSDGTIQALLAEVRQLRLALERSAVVAPRIQLTLHRMQFQQEAVSRVSRQLEDIRSQMAGSASVEEKEIANIRAHMKEVEARSAQELDPARRKVLEDEVSRLRQRLEKGAEKTDQQRLNEAQQIARASELAGRLQTEQAKLDELGERLNTLERLLDAPQLKQP
jgi:hypothetical protein